MALQPQKYEDFSGGFTDNIIGARPNQGEIVDNFYITSANKLKQRPGSFNYTTGNFNTVVKPGGTNLAMELIPFGSSGAFLVAKLGKLFARGAVNWAEVQVGGSSAFGTSNVINWVDVDSQIYAVSHFAGLPIDALIQPPIKIFQDASAGNAFKAIYAGLPEITSAEVSFSSTGGAKSYIYALAWERTYTTPNGTYTDIGPAYLAPVSVDFTVGNTVTISKVPPGPFSLSSGYGTVALGIYRTVENGSVFYKVTSTNANYTDSMSDATLQTKETLYINGGVLDNDPPPRAKCLTYVNGFAYYGGIYDGTSFRGNKIRQSVKYDPDSVPIDFECEIDNEVMTMGAAGGFPIVVGKKGVWRIEGAFDELGRGNMNPIKISDATGGVSIRGGVTVGNSFFFAGSSGYFICDGYSVKPISEHISTTYALGIGAERAQYIQAAYDSINKRVAWISVSDSSTFTLHVLDLTKPLSEESSFTRFTGTGDCFKPTGLMFYAGELYRADSQGFLFIHRDGYVTDPKVDRSGTGTITSDFVHVPWKWRSAADDFGMGAVRKYVPTANFQFLNHGNLSVQPKSINDTNDDNIREMLAIRFRQEYKGLITEKRTFPAATDSTNNAGGLKCSYKQVQLEPAKVIMAASDDANTKASFAAGQVTLDANQYDGLTPSTYQWPSNCEDWYVSFEIDDYVTEYLITNRVSGTVLAVDGAPPAGSMKWVLRGIPKDETCEIVSVTLWGVSTGSPQKLPTGDQGQNA